MKIKNIKKTTGIFCAIWILSSCSFIGDNGSLDGPGPITDPGTSTQGSTLLTGSQSTSLILTDHNPDPTLPDYCIEGDFIINAAVIIQPGVTICMKENASIIVSTSGSLDATGTASLPITIKGITPVAGYWETIDFHWSNSTSNKLIYVNISDGGANSNYDAMVYGYSGGRLYMDHCNLTRSLRYGIHIYSASFNLTGLSNTNISSCQIAPIKLATTHLGSLSESITGSGNGVNNIITSAAPVSIAGVWKKTGFPYLFSGFTDLNSNITINPGAQFIMSSTAKIRVNSSGSMKAIGTPGEMIRFVGENSIAGSWGYIMFSGSNNPNNIMRYCEVSFGGNDASNNALIFLFSGSQFKLGNSSIHGSQSWGLRNYNNGNTFTNEGSNTFYNNASGDIGT